MKETCARVYKKRTQKRSACTLKKKHERDLYKHLHEKSLKRGTLGTLVLRHVYTPLCTLGRCSESLTKDLYIWKETQKRNLHIWEETPQNTHMVPVTSFSHHCWLFPPLSSTTTLVINITIMAEAQIKRAAWKRLIHLNRDSQNDTQTPTKHFSLLPRFLFPQYDVDVGHQRQDSCGSAGGYARGVACDNVDSHVHSAFWRTRYVLALFIGLLYESLYRSLFICINLFWHTANRV